jgi:hypothetical protein
MPATLSPPQLPLAELIAVLSVATDPATDLDPDSQ